MCLFELILVETPPLGLIVVLAAAVQ